MSICALLGEGIAETIIATPASRRIARCALDKKVNEFPLISNGYSRRLLGAIHDGLAQLPRCFHFADVRRS
jgi:hypothetical protein